MDTTQITPTDSPEALDPHREVEFLQNIIALLQPLNSAARSRILEAAATFLGISQSTSAIGGRGNTSAPVTSSSESRRPSFSADLSMSAKEFMLEKQPMTDVERVACLAYYLTHYRDQPFFKTLDISKLNTEAAQPKFSNAADASNNAVKRNYLVASSKGQRQISAAGERFVLALPDRIAAREAMASARPKRRTKRARSKPATTQ